MINYLDTDDNIVALATADGLASIAVVRVSGKRLEDIYKLIAQKKSLPRPNSIYFNKIYSPVSCEHLDDGLISYFEGSNSFTGESVLEINCHGGNYIANQIISHIIESKCARLALPGEFSFRAFYNGKIDLVQAEAINDIINSEVNIYTKKSLENINGQLSNNIGEIKNRVVSIISLIEHELDFNEDEIDFTENQSIISELECVYSMLNNIESSFLHSKIIRDGIRVLLLGKPNVGKSSLFNYLIGDQRAIVSDVSGTTRDLIEAVFEIDGYRVTLIDSAGVINSEDYLEKIAVEKTRGEIDRANIVVVLADSGSDINRYDALIEEKATIRVLSKSDILKYEKKYQSILRVSSKNGDNISKLLTELSTEIKLLSKTKNRHGELLINKRQHHIIINAKTQIKESINTLKQNLTHDILADQLHRFLDIFNDITHPTSRNDIINNIFSNFCVGK